MGASAVILFTIPNSPLAQPWPFIGGQLICAVIGVACARWFGDIALASACAVGGSIFAMLLLRCLHPPGAATAMAPILAGDPITSLGYGFVLMPVGLNMMIMLIMATVINRWLLQHDVPELPDNENLLLVPDQQTGISEPVLKRQKAAGKLLDISAVDIYTRSKSHITCADIMVRDVPSVEYGTDVEQAWQIMHKQKLKAMPVIDKAKRVIGIITWHDFFKFINLNAYEGLQDRLHGFIRRTPGIATNKPESVGHIMTTSVAMLSEKDSIADVISLISTQGYRQIPVVNSEKRLVGMVYQANLIAALDCEKLSLAGAQR